MGNKKKQKQVLFIGLGLLAILLKWLSGLFPDQTERFYSRTVFVGIRFLLDHSFGLLPFSSLYLLIPALLLWGGFKWFKQKKAHAGVRTGWLQKLGRLAFTGLALFCLLIFLVYSFWGFNYDRIPIETHLGLTVTALDEAMIRTEAAAAVSQLLKSRSEIPGGCDNPLSQDDLPKNLESLLQEGFRSLLLELNYPASGRVRLRTIHPGGLIMRLGVAGFYMPLTGEAHLPAPLTVADIPFCAAHEMAHGQGFANEGAANFMAFLVCIRSPHPLVCYSANLAYFNHIAHELSRVSPQEYKALLARLSEGVRADLRARRETWQKYQSWLSDVGNTVNNLYLKSQGVREGILSYNRLLVLYTAYKNRQ